MSDREEGHPIAQAAISLGIAYCIWNVGRAIYHRPIVCAVIAAVFLVVCLMTGSSFLEVFDMAVWFVSIFSVVGIIALYLEYGAPAVFLGIIWLAAWSEFGLWIDSFFVS